MIFYFFLVFNLSYASSTYRPPPSSGPKYYAPQKRSAKEAEKVIRSWQRSGVSLHEFSGGGEEIIIHGSYSLKENFDPFLKRLKGEDGGVKREVKVKETKSTFGGSSSIDFELKVQNAW